MNETDFRTRNKDADPAFALWSVRRAEMNDLLKEIDNLRKSKSTPLAGFDAVVGQFVRQVEDLTALLGDYQAGKDIAPQLTEKRLSLAAFLDLMRSRDLAAAGTVLEADWAEVYAIAAQVTKLGRYPAWRAEEQVKGLTLGPDYFVLPDPTTPLVDLPEWRATLQARRMWQATLHTRIDQQQEAIQALGAVVDAAEAEALPGLRDLLVATAGDAARGLLIDLAGGAAQRTTRLAQAIETLQGALFAVRVGTFAADHPAAGWKLAPSGYSEAKFDEDWVFWGAYETWQGAMRVFIFPESHLLPTLRPASASEPTQAYRDLIKKLRGFVRITPDQARDAAAHYLDQLRGEFADIPTFPQDLKSSTFVLTERLTDKQLARRQALSVRLMGTFTDPHQAPSYLKEVFYFVPLLCALHLQRSAEYLAALDWFQTVYAYHLPPGRLTADKLPPGTLPADKPLPDRRQIYYGLTLEEQIPTKFQRQVNWPREGLNPHDIVRFRANALTRFTVISLVRCFEAFADAEFTRENDESVARARALVPDSSRPARARVSRRRFSCRSAQPVRPGSRGRGTAPSRSRPTCASCASGGTSLDWNASFRPNSPRHRDRATATHAIPVRRAHRAGQGIHSACHPDGSRPAGRLGKTRRGVVQPAQSHPGRRVGQRNRTPAGPAGDGG